MTYVVLPNGDIGVDTIAEALEVADERRSRIDGLLVAARERLRAKRAMEDLLRPMTHEERVNMLVELLADIDVAPSAAPAPAHRRAAPAPATKRPRSGRTPNRSFAKRAAQAMDAVRAHKSATGADINVAQLADALLLSKPRTYAIARQLVEEGKLVRLADWRVAEP